MVGPIGVDHLNFGDSGVALLVFGEVFLAEGDVGFVHGKSALGDEGGKARFIKLTEAFDDFDGLGVGCAILSVLRSSRDASRASMGLMT